MLVGGIIALTRDVLKQVLAYSTISQYGYVVVLYGLGGKYGAVGAAFYVLAHGVAKSALFLTPGAVTEATAETRLSRLGGLARQMPVLAVASASAAAASRRFRSRSDSSRTNCSSRPRWSEAGHTPVSRWWARASRSPTLGASGR